MECQTSNPLWMNIERSKSVYSVGHGHNTTIDMTAAYTVSLAAEMEKLYSSFQMWEHEEKIMNFPWGKVL